MKKILAFVFLVTAAVSVKAQTVSVNGTTTLDLSATDANDSVAIIVPLKIEPANASFAGFRILGNKPSMVRLNTSAQPVFRDAFMIIRGERLNELIVAVRLKDLHWAGTYTVELMYGFGTDTVQPKTLTFTVNRPPALPESNSRISAGMIGSALYGNAIWLHESTGRAGIPHLKPGRQIFEQIGAAELFTFTAPEYKLPAGGEANITYSVNEKNAASLPIGTYKGKIYFNSPSLTAGTFSVDVEFTHKRTRTWIFLIVLLGSLTGLAVRTGLKSKTDSEGARLNALVLEKEIREDSRKIHDADFQKRITALLDAMHKAFEPRSVVSQQAAAVASARTEYQKERTEFFKSLETHRIDYNRLAQPVFNMNRQPIAGQLYAVRSCLLEAKAHLDALDLSGADPVLDDAQNHFSVVVSNYQLYINSIAALITEGNFWPMQTRPEIKSALGKQASDLTTLSAQLSIPSTNSGQTLTQMDQLQSIAGGVADLIYQLLLGDFTAIDGTAAQDSGFLHALHAFTDAFKNMSINPNAVTNAGFYLPSNLATNLNDAWTAAVNPGMKAFSANAGKVMANSALAFHLAAPLAALLEQSATPVNYLLQRPARPLTLSESIAQTKARYWLLTSLQTLILMLLIALGAYQSLGDTWMGTEREMLLLFLGAFSLDITANSITDIKSKIR